MSSKISEKMTDSEYSDNVVDMFVIDNCESEESAFVCEVPTQNRFEAQRDGRGSEWRQSRRTKRKKVSSSGSIETNGFDELPNSEKLTRLFETVLQNKDMLTEISKEQYRYYKVTEQLQKNITNLSKRTELTERRVDQHAQILKSLAYRSVDMEARSRRNNIIIWGVTENSRMSTEDLVLCFMEDELDIDASQMVIDRAHRMGYRSDYHRNHKDPKRPIIVRFRDYSDTEYVMKRAYKLRGTSFGLDRDYPMEIATARKELYKSPMAQEARADRKKVQIKYPAKLIIDGKLVLDKFPEWQRLLRENRIDCFESQDKQRADDDIDTGPKVSHWEDQNEYERHTEIDSASVSLPDSESVFNVVRDQVNTVTQCKQTGSTQCRGDVKSTQSRDNRPTRQSRSVKKSVNLPVSDNSRHNSSDRRLPVNSKSKTHISHTNKSQNYENNTNSNPTSRVNFNDKQSTHSAHESKNRQRENPVSDNSATANNDNNYNTRL